jgi:hypothetical protein
MGWLLDPEGAHLAALRRLAEAPPEDAASMWRLASAASCPSTICSRRGESATASSFCVS